MEKRRDNKFTVEFEHVSFKYPGAADYVIKDLNLKFVVGEKLAIVGKNGSGKTTFIKLLCRLYDVTEGCIKVNGIDIRKYDYREYCDLFGVVFQDFCVFDFPLGENMANSTDVNEEHAIDALSRAGLGDRLRELPKGLNTCIGKDFDEMVGKKTAIYISHRLVSCKFCEDILVFDKGKVVQHGTHEELEKQADGLYRKLWNAQAQYYT